MALESRALPAPLPSHPLYRPQGPNAPRDSAVGRRWSQPCVSCRQPEAHALLARSLLAHSLRKTNEKCATSGQSDCNEPCVITTLAPTPCSLARTAFTSVLPKGAAPEKRTWRLRRSCCVVAEEHCRSSAHYLMCCRDSKGKVVEIDHTRTFRN